MTPDLEALGRRALACPGWRWTRGMRTTDGYRVISVGAGSGVWLVAALEAA